MKADVNTIFPFKASYIDFGEGLEELYWLMDNDKVKKVFIGENKIEISKQQIMAMLLFMMSLFEDTIILEQ